MKRTALVGLLALVSWSVQAGQSSPGWKLGVQASFADFQGDDVPDPTLNSKFIEDDTVGFKAYGQYQFNNWFGVEAAYHSMSDFEDQSTDPNFPGRFKLNFEGFSAQGLVFFPVLTDEVQGFVKAGYYDFNDDLSLSNNTKSNSSESGLVWGGGATIDITEQFGVRMDYERYDNSVGDLWAVNIGVQYSFGGSAESASAAMATPPPPPPPPPQAATPPTPLPADSDNDGVMDSSDECPETPVDTKVNAKGCAE